MTRASATSAAPTSPAPGTVVSRGLIVRVQLSNGNLAAVPDVTSAGYDEAQARAALQGAGFGNIATAFVYGALSAMTSGYVTRAYAEPKHSKWLADLDRSQKGKTSL